MVNITLTKDNDIHLGELLEGLDKKNLRVVLAKGGMFVVDQKFLDDYVAKAGLIPTYKLGVVAVQGNDVVVGLIPVYNPPENGKKCRQLCEHTHFASEKKENSINIEKKAREELPAGVKAFNAYQRNGVLVLEYLF